MKDPIKISRCKVCQGAVRVAGLDRMPTRDKTEFAKEVFKYDLEIKTIPLEIYKRLNPEGFDFCNCSKEEVFSSKLYLILSRPPEPENGLEEWEYYELETPFTVHTLKMDFLNDMWNFQRKVEKAYDDWSNGVSPSWLIKFYRNGSSCTEFPFKLFNQSGTKADEFTQDRFANDLQLLSIMHIYEGGPSFQEIINSTKKYTYVPG